MDEFCQTGKLQLLQDYISRLDDVALRAELHSRASPQGYTPLHVAALNGHASVLGLLLSKGSHINSRANSGSTPLHLAASRGHLQCVRLLVSRGADQTIKDNRGRTPNQAAVIRSDGNARSSYWYDCNFIPCSLQKSSLQLQERPQLIRRVFNSQMIRVQVV